jgi:hypothetical protein
VLSPAAIVLLSVVAAVGGFVNSIAGGGGLVTLPALLAAGLPPQIAIGTNTSVASYWHGESLDRERAALGFAAGFLGSSIGARLLLTVPLGPLRVIVMVLLLGAAVIVLAGRNVEPRPRKLSPLVGRLALCAIGLVLGAYDGFFGPGTGSLLVVAFATVFGDSLTRASGNAKVVNFASNLAAFGLFAARGTVVWRISVPMAVASVIGSAAGARLAVRNGDRLVRGVVLVVVLAVVVKLTTDLMH